MKLQLSPIAPGLALALALAACSAQQIDTASNTISSASPAFVNDALIATQIEGYFVTIDPTSALHVAVSSHGGAVRLSGRVTSAAVRDRFVDRAKTTPGVKSVSASLAIDTHLPSTQKQVSDFAVSVAVQANLAGQTGLNALPIHVATHDGTVTLSGPVKTAALRDTLLDAAKHTPGVRSVRDALKVTT